MIANKIIQFTEGSFYALVQTWLDLRIRWAEIKFIGPKIWASRVHQRHVSKGIRKEQPQKREIREDGEKGSIWKKRGKLQRNSVHLLQLITRYKSVISGLEATITDYLTFDSSVGLRIHNQYLHLAIEPTANSAHSLLVFRLVKTNNTTFHVLQKTNHTNEDSSFSECHIYISQHPLQY